MGDLEKQERVEEGRDENGEGEKERLLDGKAVVDFDKLCSSVALRSAHGSWGKLRGGEEEHQGGVLRMWEGELLDCFEDRRIAFESACCPCYRFGKNMKLAGFGSCYIQAIVYFLLVIGALVTFVAYTITRTRYFLYLAVAFTIAVGAYLGFYRTRMRKKFNIKGSDNSLDDCAYHFVCPCCTLCQESRTLEMNNVQNGTWHGRGDTLCIASYRDERKPLFELSPPSVVSMMSTDENCTENSTDAASNGS
ncbi:unnamed protein product [Sphenostylis stenocarpa]|uniref:Uncharacterized protein n=1 Tax=Sphenostylis stenocarpa TaxID=92480 RepID=A0AA86SR00_9FABA|nr:unnamed protein product [Sphenostylis stenocarpa]